VQQTAFADATPDAYGARYSIFSRATCSSIRYSRRETSDLPIEQATNFELVVNMAASDWHQDSKFNSRARRQGDQ
jgi:hypothetical protein